MLISFTRVRTIRYPELTSNNGIRDENKEMVKDITQVKIVYNT